MPESGLFNVKNHPDLEVLGAAKAVLSTLFGRRKFMTKSKGG